MVKVCPRCFIFESGKLLLTMLRNSETQRIVQNAMALINWQYDCFKTESTRKSSNIYLSWTKIEYQDNLNPIALFSTLNKR